MAAPGNLCLTVNVDWFNPFKRTPYSAGVIHLIVQNMPREERYKIENVILAGIIPGPKEPKNMNSLLDPIVSDLNKLFNGVMMKNPTSLSTVRAVLSCCVCDMPATRKLCGFLSFHAKMGCSKCMKQFPRFSSINKSDFSGFDVENWNDRQCEVHLQKAREARDANNKKARESIESSYGARFSLLHNLICFNVVRCHVVDPMHNLFLGIAKHAVDTWKKTSTLTDSDCRKIQSIVDVVDPPPGIGRIPRKIGSEFTAVTADEWKNWTITYSVYALHDILPPEDFQCWCLFVDACHILC